MPVYSPILFYVVDPQTILSKTVGDYSTWTGPDAPNGSATIVDNDPWGEGFTLDDDTAGNETARASVWADGVESVDSSVDAEDVWTLRDTVTGQVFQVVNFDLEDGPADGNYTLSEIPLVQGRSYEVVSYSSNADTAAGDPVFSYLDYDEAAYSAYDVPDPPDAGAGVVDGGSGADLIDSTYVDAQGDRVTEGDDSVVAGSGDDTILSGGGNDIVHAGPGNDTAYAGSGVDTVTGYTGDDSIDGGGGDDYLYGGTGNDTLAGDAGRDELSGGDGDDSLSGGSGTDTLFGEAGDDSLDGGSESDQVYAGAGNDTLTGGGGNDYVYGGEGDDTVIDGGGNDHLDAGAGDDLFIDGAGDDTYYGGSGLDTIDFSAATTAITVDLTSYTLGGGAAGNTMAGGIDAIIGTDFDDTLIGFDSYQDAGDSNDYTNVFHGGAGSDTIDGRGGADTLYGGDDGDVFIQRDWYGDDVIVGGEGGTDLDVLDLSAMTVPATVTYTGDEAGTLTGGGTATFSEIEGLRLTSGADSFDASASGSAARTSVAGGAGNDTLTGGAGGDDLSGEAGDDVLRGGAGGDTLSGGSGNDTITFAEGDTVYGGDGDDLFVLEDLGEAPNAPTTVYGGEGGESGGDILQLGTLADLSTLVWSDTDPGTGQSGYVMLDDGTTLSFQGMESVICFVAGTRIATPRGARRVEALRPGDLVVTRDHGLQPVRWAGRRTVPAAGRLAPVLLSPGALPGLDAPLAVSPRHRVLLTGSRAELLFGEGEVLAPACHLLDGTTITRAGGGAVTYVHILFDEHEIVYSEGLATESFHPGTVGLDAVDAAARAELFTIFPDLRADLRSYGPTARRCLKRHEARLMAAPWP